MTTTPLSRRLKEAADDLGFSTRRIVAEAEKAGLDISLYTVTSCLNGKHGQVTANTARALSRALRIPYAEVARLASLPSGRGNFRLEGRLAEYADALTKAQADVVRETIRLFAEGNSAAGMPPGVPVVGETGEGDSDEEFEVDKADRANTQGMPAPHRPRRAGHDPEWDELYGDYELAAQDSLEGIDPSNVEEQHP